MDKEALENLDKVKRGLPPYKLVIKENRPTSRCYFYDDLDLASTDYWMLFDMVFDYPNEVTLIRSVDDEEVVLLSYKTKVGKPKNPQNISSIVDANKRFKDLRVI